MAKQYYAKFTDKELAEVYTTTLANYGKIEGELLAEVERRGGEAQLKTQIAQEKVIAIEKARITREVYQYTSAQTDTSLIKQFIQSNILSKDELDALIETTYQQHQQAAMNRRIDMKTLIGCGIGFLIGSVLGASVWWLQLYFFNTIFYGSFVLIYFIAYLIIRLVSKKTAGNWLVLVTALLASFASVIIAFAIIFH